MTALDTAVARPGWHIIEDCRPSNVRILAGRTTSLAEHPSVDEAHQGVRLYGPEPATRVDGSAERRAAPADLVPAPTTLPGPMGLRKAFFDPTVVDGATAVFESMIAEQSAYGVVDGDHLSRRAANDRTGRALDEVVLREASRRNVATASAEGCAFSTDVVHDQPVADPPAATQGALARRDLPEEWPSSVLDQQLGAQATRNSAA